KEPVVFIKVTTSISGPFDDVIIPKDSQKSDWEVELALAIGSTARHVAEANALDCVAGYLICNDVSEREYQLERAGQWDKGKGCDTFAPLGPWLVTRDEVPDPQALDMWLDVNGERMQTGNTRTMIFGVAHIVSYVSRFMTLLPGDIITTGTPPGVGMGKKPQRSLKTGDVMTRGVQGLGEQRQPCVKWQAGREGRRRPPPCPRTPAAAPILKPPRGGRAGRGFPPFGRLPGGRGGRVTATRVLRG